MVDVSIVVPVYNAYDSIDRCIKSIINQTYKNFELILINDGSKDKSINKLKKYENKYSFIRVIDKKNEGVAKTRNLGIKEATGKYIMFIDNDDFIDEDYVYRYLCEIKNGYDVVIGGYRRVNQDNKILYSEKLKDYEWSKYIVVAPWARIIKKEFLIDNNIEFLSYKIGEDVYFSLLMYYYNPKIKVIDYIGYNWYYNSNSVSNTSQRGLSDDLDILYLLNKIYELYKSDSIYVNYYLFRYYIWYMLFSGKYSNKEKFLSENKRLNKWYDDKNIKVISCFSKKLKGEKFKNRLIVFTYSVLNKTKLINLFSILYCRGGKNEKK